MKELKVLNKYFLKYRYYLLFGILFVTLSNVFRVLMPKIIRDALDYVFLSIQDYKLVKGAPFAQDVLSNQLNFNLLLFGGLVLLFAAIMGVFMYFMRQTIIVMSRHIEFDMRNEIFEHYSRLNQSFFKQQKTGDLMARISEDVSKVRMYVGPALLYGINLTTLFGIVITSMFSVNTMLSIYTLLPLPVLSILIYFVSSIINKKSSIIQKQLSEISAQAQEAYSGIRVVKAYGKEQHFSSFFSIAAEDYKLKSLSLAKVNALFFPLMILLISISTMMVLYVGGKAVVNQAISPGTIAEFIIYVSMLTWPITALGWIASLIQQASASQARINEFMMIEPEISYDTQESPEHWDIEFESVGFTYPENNIEALKNVTFKASAGEKIAIVGKTASGKSTLAELLLRIYDVNQGVIKIGGQDIRNLDLEILRQKVAYVPQDVFLFSDTISDNITFGSSKDLSDSEIQQYAEYAAIAEDVKGLPNGFNTEIGERGVTLSGGQKQRISLARALIKKPKVVILDDCLSAIDAATEHKIVSFFNESLGDATAIIITHRIPFNLTFDRIIVLEEGQVSGIGTHEVLLKSNAFYKELIEQQSKLHGA